MIGPLVSPDTVPDWLQTLVKASGKIDNGLFDRFAPSVPLQLRAAAVLVLFGEGERGPDVVLQRRADTLLAHPGQVSFPGGRAETGESPIETALREAREEIGVDPSGIRPVAILPEIPVSVSRFSVTPVLAHWWQPSLIRAVDLGETAAVARISIADLVNPVNRYQAQFHQGWQGPVFEVRDFFVWGFTAGLLSGLLSLGGWEQEWNSGDIRDLDTALARHRARLSTVHDRDAADRPRDAESESP